MADATKYHNIALFVNRIAGRGRGQALAWQLHTEFQRRGWHSMIIQDRPDLCDPALIANLTAAVALGGDGTLRAVAERLTNGGEREGPGILLIPMGTANLMSLHLGLAWDTRDLERRAADAIERRRLAQIDLSRVCFTTPDGGETGRLFLLMIGVGIDGQIVRALDRMRTGPISFASYVLPSMRALAEYEFPAIEVEVDGRTVWPMAPGIAFAGNIAEYGWGLPLLPQARSDDGLLDVMVLPARSPMDLIRHTMRAVAGEHLHGEGVVYVKGRELAIRSRRAVPVQADGDPAGVTPLTARILPTRVALVVA